jgi:hypothetical protein
MLTLRGIGQWEENSVGYLKQGTLMGGNEEKIGDGITQLV